MNPPLALLRKLQVRSGSRLWLINVPRALAEELSAGAEVEVVHEEDAHDGVVAFFESPEEVAALGHRIIAGLPGNGLLWVAFRKGPPGRAVGLTRDVGWQSFTAAGWRPVRAISINDEWSGLRFRPEELVNARR